MLFLVENDVNTGVKGLTETIVISAGRCIQAAGSAKPGCGTEERGERTRKRARRETGKPELVLFFSTKLLYEYAQRFCNLYHFHDIFHYEIFLWHLNT